MPLECSANNHGAFLKVEVRPSQAKSFAFTKACGREKDPSCVKGLSTRRLEELLKLLRR